jgi:hypothetical protein
MNFSVVVVLVWRRRVFSIYKKRAGIKMILTCAKFEGYG